MDSIFLLHEKLFKGEISALELYNEAITKSKSLNNKLNAFISIDDKQTESLTNHKVGTRLIDGIPYSLKDVFSTKGKLTTAGSQFLKSYFPPYDATIFKRLTENGAVCFAKNNCDPYAFGGSGENSGFGPTANPLDMSRVPGGSSSGSAASVAAKINLYSIGSDTGGSIRQPAGLCGVVGLKVTYGLNSRKGLFAMASSFDSPGIIANNVENAYIVQKYIQGFDEQDATSIREVVYNPDINYEDIKQTLNKSIKGLKIGLPKEYFIDGMDPDVKDIVYKNAKILESLGAFVEEVSLPNTKYALPVYYILVPSEISSNMARYDGVRFGNRVENSKDFESMYLDDREILEDEVKRRIILGTYSLSKGYADKYYTKASYIRELIKKDFKDVFNKYDAILTPVSPNVAWKIGAKSQNPLELYLEDIFTVTANCAGIPGISIKGGSKIINDGGEDLWGNQCKSLPIGVQILGNHLSEDLICNIASILEQNNNA